MARWEPHARQRLVRAALDLFTEQGYHNTTVAHIAERAGLTKTTFFRHFPDKREVLFIGQDIHSQLLADGITTAPTTATPLEAISAALDATTATFTPDQREFGPQLHTVINNNRELQERDAFKRASLTAAMTTALHQRGVPDPTARLAAELGTLAFHHAFTRWIDPTNPHTFTDLARQALHELHTATTTLN